jgi:hypothetical protein
MFTLVTYNCTGNTKGGSITVQLISCLTGLESAVLQLTILFLFAKQTDPNQSNRRSMVQLYFPLYYSLDCSKVGKLAYTLHADQSSLQ